MNCLSRAATSTKSTKLKWDSGWTSAARPRLSAVSLRKVPLAARNWAENTRRQWRLLETVWGFFLHLQAIFGLIISPRSDRWCNKKELSKKSGKVPGLFMFSKQLNISVCLAPSPHSEIWDTVKNDGMETIRTLIGTLFLNPFVGKFHRFDIRPERRSKFVSGRKCIVAQD